MNPLFYVAMALALSAIAVTLHALLTAPEGYEDEEGFHSLQPKPPPKPHRTADNGADQGVHTFISAG